MTIIWARVSFVFGNALGWDERSSSSINAMSRKKPVRSLSASASYSLFFAVGLTYFGRGVVFDA